MNNFLNKIPVSPITSFGNPSVPNGATFGTNFSILQTGGYMEVYSLSGLTYTIPPATTGVIEFSGNSIPIQFTKGSGQVFSPDVLTLNSDNISSGRRKLGMLVYVYETKKIYQYNIDNYDTLWGNVTGATGPGGATVVISDFGTTVKNNTPEGQAFINAWTSSTISGIDGYDDTNASWRVLSTAGSGGAFTGGTVTGATIFTDGLTANTISAATYLNLPIIPQDYLPLSGGTVTGATIFTNGLTANTISAATYQNLPQDIFVTGGTYSDGITTLTNNSGGTFTITGYFTGNTDNYITGGTFNHNTETLSLYDLTGGTVTITGFTDINVTGGTYSDGTITFTNNTGGTFNVSGLYTGTTDVFVTGATYYDGTATFTNNTGGTFNLTGLTTPFTGGTVSGDTIFTNGLTSTTISATTYQNLPIDIRVTGGTYYNTSGTTIFTNNTGGTFSVSGFSKMLWYAENDTPPTVSPTAVGAGSIVFGDGATSSGSDSFVFGSGATSNGNNLNVFGANAGQSSFNPSNSNFFGVNAGQSSYQPNNSNLFGESAGRFSFAPQYSNFLGYQAGQSSYQSDNSNFLGYKSGIESQFAEYSNFFGYQVGSGLTGSNNIIIGTNITLPNGTYNAINLGNVLYGINTYSGITGTPNSTPTIDGKIGIGIVTPLETLHVGGNTLIDNGLTSTTISATTYLNLPNTAFTGGTVTGATRFTNGLTANTISASTYNLNTINNFSLVGNGNITISGGTSVTRRNANNSTNDAINYCGIALGTNVLDSAAAWTITRITVAVDGSVTTAISAVNSIWNNRESISYT